jgi:predicted class III extradiol MEMO1 family dioxygenase
MASLDRPKLRLLSAQWIERWGQTYTELQDPLRAFTDPVRIPIDRYQWVVRHFDGRTALSDIQVRLTRETGQWTSSAELERVVAQLDRAMVLDGPTFAAFHETYRRERVRTPAHAGRSYLGTERALRAQLGQFSAHAKGSGLPRDGAANRAERLRGILSPHIDFDCGGPVYTWSYKELIERSDADTFVILVPILVGSFYDLMQAGIDPIEAPEVRRFVEALRAAESASGKRVAYIGGIDLCHVGPEFGDLELLDRATLDTVRGFDTAMLDRAAAGDPAGWFGTAALVGNRWRVCGLAAAYTMLHAMGPAQGRLLRYDQAVNPERTCCVSFARLAFDAAHANGTGTAAETEVRHRV